MLFTNKFCPPVTPDWRGFLFYLEIFGPTGQTLHFLILFYIWLTEASAPNSSGWPSLTLNIWHQPVWQIRIHLLPMMCSRLYWGKTSWRQIFLGKYLFRKSENEIIFGLKLLSVVRKFNSKAFITCVNILVILMLDITEHYHSQARPAFFPTPSTVWRGEIVRWGVTPTIIKLLSITVENMVDWWCSDRAFPTFPWQQ